LQNLLSLFGERSAIALILEFAGDVNVRGADSRVNARAPARGEGLAASLDVAGHGAGEGADGGPLNLAADALDGLEILRGRSGISGLDHIHVQQHQLPRDDQLLAASQAGSGGLFPVTQGGVEYSYFLRRWFLTHGFGSLTRLSFTPAE
jgi:hypothetical protein